MRLCVGVGVYARACVCRMQGGREGRRDATVPKPSVIASLSTARPGSGHQSASPQITPISRGAEGEELKDSLRGEIPPRYSGGEHPRRQWGNSREQRCSGAEAGGGGQAGRVPAAGRGTIPLPVLCWGCAATAFHSPAERCTVTSPPR